MKKTTAFWDSSALVPLCIREAGSRQAQLYLRKFDLVVWWGSLVEVHGAICRLHRAKEISDANKQGVWCHKQPSRRNFICTDRRLAQAADAAGFFVLEIPTANP